MVKVFIGGKWDDKKQIKQYISDITNKGHVIVHDWTTYETAITKEMPLMAKIAIDGIIKANIVIIIMTDPNYAYRGTFTELGCAIGVNQVTQSKQIYLLCPDTKAVCRENVFFHHPSIVHFTSWDDIIKKISDILEPEPNDYQTELGSTFC